MTNTNYYKHIYQILKGVGVTFLLGIVGYVFVFFTRILSARYFGPEKYGEYELALTIFGIFILIAGLGLSTSILRYVPIYIAKKNYKKLKGYITFIFITHMSTSIFTTFCLFIFAKNITSFFNLPNTFTTILKIISLFIIFRIFSMNFINLFASKKKIFISEFGDKVIERLLMLISILLIFFYKLPLFYFIIGYGLSTFISFIYYFVMFLKEKTFIINDIKPNYNILSWLKYGLPLFFACVFGFILSWTDNLIIARHLGSLELGVYSIAYSIGYYILLIPSSFTGIFMPILGETFTLNKNNFIKIFKTIRNLVFSLAVFIGFILIFFSNDLINILYGFEYARGTISILILTTFFIFSTYFYFYGFILLINKNTIFTFYTQMIFAIFNIILSLLLIQKFNIEGIAFASGLSFFLFNFVQFIKINKTIKIPFDFKYNIKILISALSSIGLIKIINIYLLNMNIIIKIPILIGLYTIFFILFVIILKTFTKEDFKIYKFMMKKCKLT